MLLGSIICLSHFNKPTDIQFLGSPKNLCLRSKKYFVFHKFSGQPTEGDKFTLREEETVKMVRRFKRSLVRARSDCCERQRKRQALTGPEIVAVRHEPASVVEAQSLFARGEKELCAVLRDAVCAWVQIEGIGAKIVAKSGDYYDTIVVPSNEFFLRLWRASEYSFGDFLSEMARSTRVYIRASKPMSLTEVLQFMGRAAWPVVSK